MVSRVTIRRTAASTVDGAGFEVPGWTVVATDVPFRLGGSEQGGAGTRTVNVGGVDVQVATRVGSFPASQSNLKDGDYLDVTEGESAGLVLRVVEATWQDQATARRVPVLEVQRPEEW